MNNAAYSFIHVTVHSAKSSILDRTPYSHNTHTHNAQSKGEKNENSIPHSWWVTREVWRMEKAISRKSHQPFNGTERETETTPQKRPSQTKNVVIRKKNSPVVQATGAPGRWTTCSHLRCPSFGQNSDFPAWWTPSALRPGPSGVVSADVPPRPPWTVCACVRAYVFREGRGKSKKKRPQITHIFKMWREQQQSVVCPFQSR